MSDTHWAWKHLDSYGPAKDSGEVWYGCFPQIRTMGFKPGSDRGMVTATGPTGGGRVPAGA
jgi:hypothetical protein